jgi:ABC-type lipoprotein export system ATPase subunit
VEVRLRGVGHRFPGGDFLFRDLDVLLRAGRVYAVTGPSGAGKSTLLSMLAGWLRPTEGRIACEGVHRTSWVFQNPHGVAARAALDHVVLPYLARGMDRRCAERLAGELLASFDLQSFSRAPYSTLSGGQAQRLMLARGIASAPQLLLVDEPTAQLDRASADLVNLTLTGLRSPRSIVVIATHDPQTMAQCTDQVDLGEAR